MKRLLACILSIALMLACLTSCSLFTHRKNQWFSGEKLTKCIVPDMPQLACDFVKDSDKVIYANLTKAEFDDYLNELYAYLLAKDFEYIGTRGEVASSLSGAFTTYYFEPAIELSEFNISAGTYKFVYSDGQISMSSEGDDFTFCILTIGHYESTQTIEYGINKFDYNTEISLKFNSEAPLGGRYILNQHEHTGEWHTSETTHYYQYTCGCPSPDIAELHLDGDGDGKCDVCKYYMLGEGNYFLRNQAGCEWLNEISAENIAEIKIIGEAVGVAPGNIKNISSSTDESVITRIFEEYYLLDTAPISKMEGQIDGGSGVTVKFILKNGAIKELYINNGNYRDTNGNYFELNNTPQFNDTDSKTKAYGFITYLGTGTVYDKDNNLVCEISIDELEFIAFDGDLPAVITGYYYTVDTEFGTLWFTYNSEIFFVRFDGEDNYTESYQLVGKNLDELIAEYTVTSY